MLQVVKIIGWEPAKRALTMLSISFVNSEESLPEDKYESEKEAIPAVSVAKRPAGS